MDIQIVKERSVLWGAFLFLALYRQGKRNILILSNHCVWLLDDMRLTKGNLNGKGENNKS